MLYEEKQIETIPVGPLGLIPLKSCEDLGKKVDAWLVEWRKERESEHKTTIAFAGYQKDSYIIGAKTPRFGSGEAKGELTESVRGDDLYIMVEVCNLNILSHSCASRLVAKPRLHFCLRSPFHKSIPAHFLNLFLPGSIFLPCHLYFPLSCCR